MRKAKEKARRRFKADPSKYITQQNPVFTSKIEVAISRVGSKIVYVTQEPMLELWTQDHLNYFLLNKMSGVTKYSVTHGLVWSHCDYSCILAKVTYS